MRSGCRLRVVTWQAQRVDEAGEVDSLQAVGHWESKGPSVRPLRDATSKIWKHKIKTPAATNVHDNVSV